MTAGLPRSSGRVPVPRRATIRCCTSARPPTSASVCAATSAPTIAARSARCCARRNASRTSPLPTCSPPRCSSCVTSNSSAPRYNKVGTAPQKYRYVRLTTDEAWPRLSVVNEATGAGVYLGPLPSKANADAVVEALQIGLPVAPVHDAARALVPTANRRRSPARRRNSVSPCARAQAQPMPSTTQPSSPTSVQAMTTSPELVIAHLAGPAHRRCRPTRRYEEAAQVRDRAMAFTNAMRRQRLTDRLREAGDVGLQIGDTMVHVRNGVLVGTALDGQMEIGLPVPAPDVPTVRAAPPPPCGRRGPVPGPRVRTNRPSRHCAVVRRSVEMADRGGSRGGRAHAATAARRRAGCLVGCCGRSSVVGFDHGAAVIDAQHLGVAVGGHACGQVVGVVEWAHRRHRRARTRQPRAPRAGVERGLQRHLRRFGRGQSHDPDEGGPAWRCATRRCRRPPARRPAARCGRC